MFVVTADHTGLPEGDFYSNHVGSSAVPLLFYMHNTNLKGKNHITAQHTDILPSVIDFLGVPKNYFSFGESVFDSAANHFSLCYSSNLYHFISGENILQFDGEKSIALFNFQKDSLLKNNILKKETAVKEKMETHLKAIIQSYNHALINNKMTAE